MSGSVSTRLLERLERRQSHAIQDYRRGKAAGADWADQNLFSLADAAPLTADCAESPFNRGVVRGIAEALRRFANQLDPPHVMRSPQASVRALDLTEEPE